VYILRDGVCFYLLQEQEKVVELDPWEFRLHL